MAFAPAISKQPVTPMHDSSSRTDSKDLNPNPLPAKAMARHLGYAVGQCRLPMGAADSSLDAEAAAVYKRLVASRG